MPNEPLATIFPPMTNRTAEREIGRGLGDSLGIEIVVNGERRAAPAGSTVGDLLRAHGLDPRLVVVERNRVILRDRASFDELALSAGDTIEIVHFVGGG